MRRALPPLLIRIHGIIMIMIITAIELSLGGSSPYTSTGKTNKNIHKQKKKKNTV